MELKPLTSIISLQVLQDLQANPTYTHTHVIEWGLVVNLVNPVRKNSERLLKGGKRF